MKGSTVLFSLLAAILLCCAAVSQCAAESPKEMLAAGRVDDTISELKRQLSAAPANAELSNLLCRAYYSLEEWEQAETSCRKAVSLDPDNSNFHLWLGRVYGEKADRTNFVAAASLAGKVHAEFEHAVQLNPKNLEARLDLSEFYIEAPGFMGGGDDKAREEAQALSTLSPGREHWVYARIAEKKKNSTVAEREYLQYIDASNNDSEAWLNYALFLRRQSRLDDMEQAVAKLERARISRVDSLFEAANTLYRANRNYPLAIQVARHYLTAGSVEAAPAFRAHYLLGELLEKQNDLAGAKNEYRASLSLAGSFTLAQHALERLTH
jgi:tetratricopeptide (TPR) repeat protein